MILPSEQLRAAVEQSEDLHATQRDHDADTQRDSLLADLLTTAYPTNATQDN